MNGKQNLAVVSKIPFHPLSHHLFYLVARNSDHSRSNIVCGEVIEGGKGTL